MAAADMYQSAQGAELRSGEAGVARMIGYEYPIASAWSFVNFPNAECTLYRRFHATTQIGPFIYVFGGETKTRPTTPGAHSIKQMLGDLLCYDIANATWKVLDSGGSDSPMPRKGAILEAYNSSSLLLCGGAASGGTFNDLWEFCLAEGRWVNLTVTILEQLLSPSGAVGVQDAATAKALLSQLQKKKSSPNEVAQTVAAKFPDCYPAPRAYFVAVLHKHRLIIYGGYGFRNESSALWVYDIPAEKWQLVPLVGRNPTPEGGRHSHPGVRFGLVACCYGDNMFIFGGQQQSKLVASVLWRLDLDTFTWQQVGTTGSAPAQRTYATGCLIGNRWFLHGGSSADDVFADSHELNLDVFHWHPSNNLLTSVTIEGHTSACIFSEWGVATILLIGGATSGPGIPDGPVMQSTFLMSDIEVLVHGENSRLEDLVIRPMGASQLLWEFARQLIASKREEDELELERLRNKELMASQEDLQMQYGELMERLSLMEKQIKSQQESQRKTDTATSPTAAGGEIVNWRSIQKTLIRTEEIRTTMITRVTSVIDKVTAKTVGMLPSESNEWQNLLAEVAELKSIAQELGRNLTAAITDLTPPTESATKKVTPRVLEPSSKSKNRSPEYSAAPRPESALRAAPEEKMTKQDTTTESDAPPKEVDEIKYRNPDLAANKENLAGIPRQRPDETVKVTRLETITINTTVDNQTHRNQAEKVTSNKMVDTMDNSTSATPKAGNVAVSKGVAAVALGGGHGSPKGVEAQVKGHAGLTRGVSSHSNPLKGKLDLKPRSDKKRADVPGNPTSNVVPADGNFTSGTQTVICIPGIDREVQIGQGALKLSLKTTPSGGAEGVLKGAADDVVPKDPVPGRSVGIGAGSNLKI